MKTKLKKIVVAMLIAIFWLCSSSNIIKAAYLNKEQALTQMGQADYHLKYYNSNKGMYTYVICKIVGYKRDTIFYPAYCLNKELQGIGTVDDYAVEIQEMINNDKIWRVIKNGYPNKKAGDMGLSSDWDSYIITKMAVYCVSGQSDINLFTVDDNDEYGKKMLSVLQNLVSLAENGIDSYSTSVNITKQGDFVEDGEYYSQNYKVESKAEISSYNISAVNGLSNGDLITDEYGNIKTTFNSNEKFKIKILKSNLNKNVDISINLNCTLKTCPIFYGKTKIEGTQNYAITTRSYEDIATEVDFKLNTNTGKITVNKIDDETKLGIENTVFELYNSEDELISTMETDKDGIINFENLYPGKYVLKEVSANEKYLIGEKSEYELDVKYNENTNVTIENERIKGTIQIVKKAAEESEITGIGEDEPIEGVIFDVYDLDGNIVDTVTTDKDGIATTKKLDKGEYKVKEKESNKWYFIDENFYDVKIEENNQNVVLNIENQPIIPDEEIQKTGPEKAKEGDEIEYKISLQNTGNVDLENFYWEDEIPVDYINVTKIKLGTFNQENSYDIYYKTNLCDEYLLFMEDISTKDNSEIDFTKELSENEYITNIKLDFGQVEKGFQSETETSIFATVKNNLQRGATFENKVNLHSEYKGYEIDKCSICKTIIQKLLPITGM